MSQNIEMDDLVAKRNQQAQVEQLKTDVALAATIDNSLSIWAGVAAAWFGLLAIPFLAFPRFILFLSLPFGSHRDQAYLTPLENFMGVNYALMLTGLAACLVIATPPTSPALQSDVSTGSTGHPMLVPITAVTFIGSLVGWNVKDVGSLGLLFSVGNGLVAAWGFWVMLFAGGASISRKTGADKRTSSFLFHNKTSASAQKKALKKAQKAL